MLVIFRIFKHGIGTINHAHKRCMCVALDSTAFIKLIVNSYYENGDKVDRQVW